MSDEKLLKIISHYGLNAQLKYMHTEYFELDEAIMTIDKVEFSNKHIAEELADVMVMLKQIQLYFNISDEEIDKIASEKIDRQLERIEKEREDEH